MVLLPDLLLLAEDVYPLLLLLLTLLLPTVHISFLGMLSFRSVMPPKI